MCYNASLTELKLDRNRLRQRGEIGCTVSSLAMLLEVNHSFKHLSLAHCDLGDSGLALLSHGLIQNHTLNVLNLQSNELTNEGLKAFSRSFQKGITSLSNINLQDNHISDEGAISLAHSLRYLKDK